MKRIVKIVGFNGTPDGYCGIVVPVILGDDEFYYKMGLKKESSIPKSIFDTYVQEERITKLPETEGKDGDAILYVTELFINSFECIEVKKGINFWLPENGNIISYYDNLSGRIYSKIQFQEVADCKIWFAIKNESRLIKQMNRWTELLCRSFDVCWNLPQKDMSHLLTIAEAIDFCAYDKKLVLQGSLRLGLVDKHFDRTDSFNALYTSFVKHELGLKKDDFENQIKELEKQISGSKQIIKELGKQLEVIAAIIHRTNYLNHRRLLLAPGISGI